MTRDDYLIRTATIDDVPQIAEIYAYHVLHGVGTFEIEPPDAAEMGARLKGIQEKNRPWLVAESEGSVVGFAYAGPFRARPAYDWTVEDSIYLRNGFEGRGIGTALLKELIARCTALGCRQMVSLIGDSENAGSIRLHRRCGFDQVGLFKAVGWKHGRWLDVVFMQRALGVGDTEDALYEGVPS